MQVGPQCGTLSPMSTLEIAAAALLSPVSRTPSIQAGDACTEESACGDGAARDGESGARYDVPASFSAACDHYRQLRRIAAQFLRGERIGHTLDPTALVHEALVRLALAGERGTDTAAPDAIVPAAVRMMRNVLTDYARRRKAGKRLAAGARVALAGIAQPPLPQLDDLLDLDDALARLAEIDARSARVVELRFFGELTTQQVAHCLGVSTWTVENDWRAARAWLGSVLQREHKSIAQRADA